MGMRVTQFGSRAGPGRVRSGDGALCWRQAWLPGKGAGPAGGRRSRLGRPPQASLTESTDMFSAKSRGPGGTRAGPRKIQQARGAARHAPRSSRTRRQLGCLAENTGEKAGDTEKFHPTIERSSSLPRGTASVQSRGGSDRLRASWRRRRGLTPGKALPGRRSQDGGSEEQPLWT